jgi:5-formyltetrahydrofolate cyclo-ligase
VNNQALKQTIRKKLRAARQALMPSEHEAYSAQIADQLFQHFYFQKAQHIGFYAPLPEEVSTKLILNEAFRQQKHCYLPVVSDTVLDFIEIDPKTPLSKNRFGILEPSHSLVSFSAQCLDMVLVPLVAFDENGHRLGMGGGFYDKTFSFRKKKETPYLIGLAYGIQKVAHLPQSLFDIGLDEVITEKERRVGSL